MILYEIIFNKQKYSTHASTNWFRQIFNCDISQWCITMIIYVFYYSWCRKRNIKKKGNWNQNESIFINDCRVIGQNKQKIKIK